MLGARIDKSLNWCAYTDDICKRQSSVVFALGILAQEVFKFVYFASFQSIMNYLLLDRSIDVNRAFIIQEGNSGRISLGMSSRKLCRSVFERIGVLT